MAESSFKAAVSRFVTVFAFIFLLFLFIDPSVRMKVGRGLNVVLNPVIGFGGSYPLWTLFCAAIIMLFLSTLIRNLFIDWAKLAEVQKKTRAYQKELRKAYMAKNMYKVKKLKELQPKIMRMSTGLSGAQIKPMAYTMLIVIPIFTWLLVFIPNLEEKIIELPWGATYSLMGRLWMFPKWIPLYMLLSIPLGQLFREGLKALKYRGEYEHHH